MTYDEGCFACGATQVELRGAEVASFPPRHVRLCDDCGKTFEAASLLEVDRSPSDFALKLSAALDTPAPGSPSTG